MKNDKELVLETLSHLPESVSLSDIQKELSILAAIRRAQAEADAGELVPHAEVVKMVGKWAGPNPPSANSKKSLILPSRK